MRARIAAAALAAVLAACGDGAAPPAPGRSGLPPLPPVERMTPDDRADVLEARRLVETDGSSAAWLAYTRALYMARVWEPGEEAALRAADAPGADRFLCLYVAAMAMMADRDRHVAGLRKALAVRDDYAPAHLRMGAAMEQYDRPDEAEKHYLRAAQLGAVGDARLGLGRIALARGDAAGAVALLEQARATLPGRPEVLVALAAAHAQAGDAARAAEIARLVPPTHQTTPIDDPLMVQFFRR